MVGGKDEHSAIYIIWSYIVRYIITRFNSLKKKKKENLSNKTLLLDVFIERKYNDVYNILQ